MTGMTRYDWYEDWNGCLLWCEISLGWTRWGLRGRGCRSRCHRCTRNGSRWTSWSISSWKCQGFGGFIRFSENQMLLIQVDSPNSRWFFEIFWTQLPFAFGSRVVGCLLKLSKWVNLSVEHIQPRHCCHRLSTRWRFLWSPQVASPMHDKQLLLYCWELQQCRLAPVSCDVRRHLTHSTASDCPYKV